MNASCLFAKRVKTQQTRGFAPFFLCVENGKSFKFPLYWLCEERDARRRLILPCTFFWVTRVSGWQNASIHLPALKYFCTPVLDGLFRAFAGVVC